MPRRRSNPRAAAALKAAQELDKKNNTPAPTKPSGGRRTREQQRKVHESRAANKAKQEAAAAAAGQGSAVGNYLGTNVDKARVASTFDKDKSEAERVASANKLKQIQQAQASGQRVSGRGASRAAELARIHGRTDEEKIASQAGASRNRRIAKDALATFLPGGAAAGYIAKGQKVAKGAKYLAAAGRGSLKAGAKRVLKDTAVKVAKQGVKKSAKTAAKTGVKVGKYLAKTKGQTAINTGITGRIG